MPGSTFPDLQQRRRTMDGIQEHGTKQQQQRQQQLSESNSDSDSNSSSNSSDDEDEQKWSREEALQYYHKLAPLRYEQLSQQHQELQKDPTQLDYYQRMLHRVAINSVLHMTAYHPPAPLTEITSAGDKEKEKTRKEEDKTILWNSCMAQALLDKVQREQDEIECQSMPPPPPVSFFDLDTDDEEEEDAFRMDDEETTTENDSDQDEHDDDTECSSVSSTWEGILRGPKDKHGQRGDMPEWTKRNLADDFFRMYPECIDHGRPGSAFQETSRQSYNSDSHSEESGSNSHGTGGSQKKRAARRRRTKNKDKNIHKKHRNKKDNTENFPRDSEEKRKDAQRKQQSRSDINPIPNHEPHQEKPRHGHGRSKSSSKDVVAETHEKPRENKQDHPKDASRYRSSQAPKTKSPRNESLPHENAAAAAASSLSTTHDFYNASNPYSNSESNQNHNAQRHSHDSWDAYHSNQSGSTSAAVGRRNGRDKEYQQDHEESHFPPYARSNANHGTNRSVNHANYPRQESEWDQNPQHPPMYHAHPYQDTQQQYNHQQTVAAPQKQNPFRTALEHARDSLDAENDHNENDSYHHHQQQDNCGYGGGSRRGGGGPQHARHAPPPAPAPRRGGPVLSEGLKRKFQPPQRKTTNNHNSTATSKNNTYIGKKGIGMRSNSNTNTNITTHPRPHCSSTKSNNTNNNSNNSNQQNSEEEIPEALRHLDPELIEKVTSEILHGGDAVTFEDIAGLHDAKQAVLEMVCWPMKRPDLFTGLRKCPNGLLLFGPPGTGKTLIGKAIAHESGATFFSISSSSLTSKWIGEGEKLVRTLFAVATVHEPAVVFIDEIDSLLTQRKSDENEASRRIKTEFLVQLDGAAGSNGKGRVLVIGATNRPHELDDAARRRFVKRLYIPLPTEDDRKVLIRTLLNKNNSNNHKLSEKDLTRLAQDTNGFSGADLQALCTDAALGPIRQLGERALTIDPGDVPPISLKHFRRALRGMKPSVAADDLKVYLEWNGIYGSKFSKDGDAGDGDGCGDGDDDSTDEEEDNNEDTE